MASNRSKGGILLKRKVHIFKRDSGASTDSCRLAPFQRLYRTRAMTNQRQTFHLRLWSCSPACDVAFSNSCRMPLIYSSRRLFGCAMPLWELYILRYGAGLRFPLSNGCSRMILYRWCRMSAEIHKRSVGKVARSRWLDAGEVGGLASERDSLRPRLLQSERGRRDRCQTGDPRSMSTRMSALSVAFERLDGGWTDLSVRPSVSSGGKMWRYRRMRRNR